MNLLLDTHAFIWWVSGDNALGGTARAEISKETSFVFFSAASAWEIAAKHASGKLALRFDVEKEIEREGFEPLAIEVGHAIASATLPDHHRDPFDRLLVAQAQIEGLTLVTSDPKIKKYRVKLLDASS